MDDNITTLVELKQRLRDFTTARDWEQFHHPKDLALALVIEVGEILEHFRYRTNEEIAQHLTIPKARREVSLEIADALWLLIRLGDVLEVDLAKTLEEKLAIAEQRYPVEKARGRSDKYTAYTKEGEHNESAAEETL